MSFIAYLSRPDWLSIRCLLTFLGAVVLSDPVWGSELYSFAVCTFIALLRPCMHYCACPSSLVSVLGVYSTVIHFVHWEEG